MIFGVLMIVVGAVWFAQTIGLVDSTVWSFVVPWLLVYVGMTFLWRGREDSCLICHMIDRSAIKEETKSSKRRKK